jgi:hypothetical protein
VNGVVSNLVTRGTNTFPAGSDIAFGRYALTSLASGNNAAVPVGTNVFVQLSGPTAAFTIAGINGQPNRDGKLVVLYNDTGYPVTYLNQSGLDPVAANRIVTATSSDVVINGKTLAILFYNAAASRWVMGPHTTSERGFGTGGMNSWTNTVIATSSSTNAVFGYHYEATTGTIGVYTNSVFWVTNAGNYKLDFGSSLLASGSDVLKLMLFTNYVDVGLRIEATMAASPLAETGHKEILLSLPADCHVQLHVANDSPASITLGNLCFNIHGVD